MPKTPDRFPGTREETELLLRSQGTDPTDAGAARYVSGDFRLRDSIGVFNPRDDEKAKVSANDTTPGYLNGKLVAGTGIALTEQNDGGNETLQIKGSGAASGTAEQYLLTEKNTDPYLKIQSGDWAVHGTLRYRGSATVGTPIAMKAILWMNGTDGTVECRVYDLTNGNVVATGGSVVDEPDPTVVSLGTVQNIPTGEAIFEIQCKRTGNEGRISWFSLDY